MTPIEIIIGILALVATGLSAYLLKKYTEVTKLFLEEKTAVLEKAIPVIEKLIPVVPDPYKKQVEEVLAFLKVWKTVNDALLATPSTRIYSKWVELKARLK
ncbi:MAG: hypothetical protein QXX83_07260 [Thermofilum sp.]